MMIVLRGILKAEEDGTWHWKGQWAFGAIPTTTTTSTAGSVDVGDRGNNHSESTTTNATTTTTTTTPTTPATLDETVVNNQPPPPPSLPAQNVESSSVHKTPTPRGRPRSQHTQSATTTSTSPTPKTRPFDYTWEKAVLPSQVLIPSLNPQVQSPEEHESDEQPQQQQQQHLKQSTTTTIALDNAVVSTKNQSLAESHSMDDSKLHENKDPTPFSATEKEKCAESHSIEDSKLKESNDPTPPLALQKIQDTDENKSTTTTTTEKPNSVRQIDKKIEAMHVSEIATTEKTLHAAISEGGPDQMHAGVVVEETTNQSAEHVVVVGDDKNIHSEEYTKREEPGITYATTKPDDPPFTDASLSYPEKCPTGGLWKGYFENLPKRRDKPPVQVLETFHLFFNSTPPNNSRIAFANEPNDNDSKTSEHTKPQQQQQNKEGLLPPGHIHVRGCGTNEFGVFEILGSFDLATGILECQRMYVVNAGSSLETPRRPSNDSGRHNTGGQRGIKSLRSGAIPVESNDSNRPYLTRKRNLSWKRRSSIDNSEGDEEMGSGRKGSGSKKRVKLEDKPIVMPSLEPLVTGAASPAEQQQQHKQQQEFLLSPLVNLPSAESLPTTTTTITTTATRPKKPPSSPRTQGLKKKAVASVATGKSPVSPTSSENRLRLPDAGDPRKARWRAAHFLYYQRHDPGTNEEGVTGNTKGSSAPSYVVYEGEMQDSLRWGHGICLYSNGMLYEGGWKRNKEHGQGTLMTSDRSRIIYDGEWERGRMHGKGTYYYGQADQITANKKKEKKIKPDDGCDTTSRYEGEFKENMRHGFGTYYLPDGSVYAGEWRDGLMFGRGVFTWPDKSVYNGEFRDGKRNGQGRLECSDGFTYDGLWVQNTMEGRGSATYPNGQKYDGLFTNGRRDGRGTLEFTNGAKYEGRFRDDAIDGQGTLKIPRTVVVPTRHVVVDEHNNNNNAHEEEAASLPKQKYDFMIPFSFQSDMSHIHQKAGFSGGGK